tara:strand:+ start:77 stop:307 length:231 start_codon:yes stop_codon:yes gene_type:complete
MNKESLKMELMKIKSSLDNLYNNLDSKDFEELERKLITSYIESNKKYIVHLCQEVINETFGKDYIIDLYENKERKE